MLNVVLDILAYSMAAGAVFSFFWLDWLLRQRMKSEDRRYGYNDHDQPKGYE